MKQSQSAIPQLCRGLIRKNYLIKLLFPSLLLLQILVPALFILPRQFEDDPERSIFYIQLLPVVIPIALVALVFIVVVSLLTAKPDAETVATFEKVKAECKK